MRSFSNILPNFATNLHLLVDSIGYRCSCMFYDKLRQKNIIYCFFFVTLCDFGFEIDILTDNNKFNI